MADVTDVINLIDRFSTCEYNDYNPYIKLQMHKHNHSCYKGRKNKNCRFHIPYPVMRTTRILTPLNDGERSLKSYQPIEKIMNRFYRSNNKEALSFDEILAELNMKEEEYILAIRSTLKQARVFLKRTSLEVNINGYNRDILTLFECNMDLQFILDEYAVISYVTNYISKIEGGLSKLLREVVKDCDNGNKSIKDKFRSITNCFLNSNLMSAQEAAYHVLSLSLSKQSRKTIYINISPRNERVLMLKSEVALRKLSDQSTEIFMDDIFKKYCKRPKKFENLCLAEFASNWKVKDGRKKNNDECDDTGDHDDYKSRQHMAIIRYRRYKLHQDPANYYREQLLLFLPWRNELQEIENINYEIKYNTKIDIIKMNQAKFTKMRDEKIDEALEHVNTDNMRDEERSHETDVMDSNHLSYKDVDIFKQKGENEICDQITKNSIKSRYTCPQRIEQEKLYDMMKALNDKQKEFVMHILNCYKLNNLPFKIFLSGSAGVGKSTVINALYQLITNYYDTMPGSDMDKIIVLLSAFSGKAAFLINGVTLHSAFSLPTDKFGVNIEKLSHDTANSIREILSSLKLLIIDEISMVGSRLLGFVDTRLKDITGFNKPFGGIPIIVVGDLNQLPPVKDVPVWKVSNQNEMAPFIDINPLWYDFEYYELTEIMRQKNDVDFINALNNLVIEKMTEENINLIRSREISKEKDIPETAIRLYATNKNVSAFNAKKISACKSDLIISNAEYIFSKKIDDQTKKLLLTSINKGSGQVLRGSHLDKLKLKINIKYMIVRNIDVEDGLVNGACGVLRSITFKDNTDRPLILWLDFQLPRVGVKAKTCHKDFMRKNNINHNLTPIKPLAVRISCGNMEIGQKQFPVVPAEAITIQKSQGQTYDKICLDFMKKERRSQQLLYVALSRVTSLSGLYILGQFSVSEMSLSTCQKDKTVLDPISIELARLRESRQLKLSFHNLVGENGVKIIYQNVGTLSSKMDYLLSDRWYTRGDLLVLSETLYIFEYI